MMNVIAMAAAVLMPIPIYFPAQPPTTTVGDYSNVHTLAVISAIGINLVVGNKGTFGMNYDDVPIGSWGLDDDVTRIIEQRLEGRFVFKKIDLDRKPFGDVDRGLVTSEPRIHELIGGIPVAAGIDAYLVVWPHHQSDTADWYGLGFIRDHHMLEPDPPPVEYANYEIELIDARTNQTIATAYSRLPAVDKWRYVRQFGGDSLKANGTDDLTPAQMSELRSNFSDLVSNSVVETLRALQLTNGAAR